MQLSRATLLKLRKFPHKLLAYPQIQSTYPLYLLTYPQTLHRYSNELLPFKRRQLGTSNNQRPTVEVLQRYSNELLTFERRELGITSDELATVNWLLSISAQQKTENYKLPSSLIEEPCIRVKKSDRIQWEVNVPLGYNETKLESRCIPTLFEFESNEERMNSASTRRQDREEISFYP